MTAFAVVLGVCFILWRLEKVAIRVFERRYAIEDRRLSVDERKVQTEERRQAEAEARAEDDRREAIARDVRAAERVHALEVRRVAIEERRFAPKPSELELPRDIENLVRMESEEWAQNDLRKTAREMFAETEDWKKVHQQLSSLLMQRSPDDRVIQ